MSADYVPEHEATSRLRVRLATPVWRLLPSRVQSWLCGCDVCLGEEEVKRRRAATDFADMIFKRPDELLDRDRGKR